MAANQRDALKAGGVGAAIALVLSFSVNYFLVPFPESLMENAVNNGVSGLLSGFMSGFMGLFMYLKKASSRVS